MADKRIYVVIAETVDTPDKNAVPSGVVPQIPGRMAAQGGHAYSRTKMQLLADAAIKHKNMKMPGFGELLRDIANAKTTVIYKACRDSRELAHIERLLVAARIRHYGFEDENPEVYGYWHPRTAIATVPVEPEDIVGILDYLPLWSPQGEK